VLTDNGRLESLPEDHAGYAAVADEPRRILRSALPSGSDTLPKLFYRIHLVKLTSLMPIRLAQLHTTSCR
jgi:hypothetical protein